MGERVTIKNGDFIVIVGRWNIEVQQAIKVKSQLVFYRDKEWNARERRIRISEVVFSGPEETARRLLDKLKSSDALCTQERRAASERQIARDEKYITAAKATGAT